MKLRSIGQEYRYEAPCFPLSTCIKTKFPEVFQQLSCPCSVMYLLIQSKDTQMGDQRICFSTEKGLENVFITYAAYTRTTFARRRY